MQGRTPGTKPHRRSGKAAIAPTIALLALAAGAQALAPTAAVALPSAGTGTGTLCVERVPGVYWNPFTEESCEPTAKSGGGETIEIYDPLPCPNPAICLASQTGGGRSLGYSDGAGRRFEVRRGGRVRARSPQQKVRSDDRAQRQQCAEIGRRFKADSGGMDLSGPGISLDKEKERLRGLEFLRNWYVTSVFQFVFTEPSHKPLAHWRKEIPKKEREIDSLRTAIKLVEDWNELNCDRFVARQ